MTYDHDNYMLAIATELRDIGHVENNEANKRFYRASSTFNIEEILQNIPIVDGLNLVVEDNEEVSIIETRSAYMFNRNLYSYYLVKKFELNNMADRRTVINELIAANKKILSRMRRDYNTDNEGTTEIGLRDIDWNSVSFFTFGPVFNNMIGLHCSFVLLDTLNTTYNESDWTDIS